MAPKEGSSAAVLRTGVSSVWLPGIVIDSAGERGRNRTYNLVIKSHLLCQLSYAPCEVGRIASAPFEDLSPPVRTLCLNECSTYEILKFPENCFSACCGWWTRVRLAGVLQP